MSAHSKVMAARVSLVLDSPFFGALALSLKLHADESQPTAWTDGRSLGYNSKFIDSLSHAQVTALVAHEVMHCAMGHPWRRDARNPGRFNVACDKVINNELRDAGFTLPPDGHYADGEEVGKSAEWIYARMGEGNDQNGNGSGNGPGSGSQSQNGPGKPDPLGEVRDAPTEPDADGEPAPSEQDWKQRTAAAAHHARMMGKLPGGMGRLVAESLKPRIDIRSLLLRFFSERSTGDYSWTRPNPRYMSQGLYMPALESRDLGEVAIMVDTSGSVDETSLAYARGIVESVIEECAPIGVTVYYADAAVCRVDRFEKNAPLTWEPAGGGGTDFCPALKAIEDEGTAVCALCITDLYGTFPEAAPGFPVLWLATTDVIAPFGETVPLDQ